MKEESKISLNDFMDTFIALCFMSDRNVLNADTLDDYLKDLFGDEYNKNIIKEYVSKNILIPVKYFEYVLNINDNIQIDTLLEGNLQYVPFIKQCIHEYVNRIYANQEKVYEMYDDSENPYKLLPDIGKTYLKKK